MSSTPVSTGCFSMVAMRAPMRWARGTPRRLMPMRPRFFPPSFFSTISWARRTRVRSISEADMRRLFSRSLGVGSGVGSVISLGDDDSSRGWCEWSESGGGVAAGADETGEGSGEDREEKQDDGGDGDDGEGVAGA